MAFGTLEGESGNSCGCLISLLVPPRPRHPFLPTGWQTPEIALIDSHKLLRSIILLLMGSDVLSIQKAAVETPFLDSGESEAESKAPWAGAG